MATRCRRRCSRRQQVLHRRKYEEENRRGSGRGAWPSSPTDPLQNGGGLQRQSRQLPNSTAETSRPADCQQQPKLGKRKGCRAELLRRARQEHSKSSLGGTGRCQLLTQARKRAPARGARTQEVQGTGAWPGSWTWPQGYDAGRGEACHYGSSCHAACEALPRARP